MKLSAQSVPIRLAATHILMIGLHPAPIVLGMRIKALDGSYSDETWNMFLGDGYPNGTSNYFYSNNDQANNHRVRWSLLTGTGLVTKTNIGTTTETTPVILVTAS